MSMLADENKRAELVGGSDFWLTVSRFCAKKQFGTFRLRVSD